jgi:hypothetical protein
MKRSKFNLNQLFRVFEADRIAKLLEQYIGILFHQLFSDTQGGDPLTDRVQAHFGDSALPEYVSGNRDVGMIFKLGAGLGFKWNPTAVTDPDETEFQPIYFAADHNLPPLAASDPTNPRIDRIFLKPKLAAANTQPVSIVDPNTVPPQSAPQNLTIDYVWSFEAAIATGAPAASPALPAKPAGYDDEDEIARIIVQPGSGGFDTDDLTDLRKKFKLSKDIVEALTTIQASAVQTNPVILGAFQVQGALERIQTALSISNPGAFVGSFEWSSTAAMVLKRQYGSKISIEIAGNIRSKADADLTFTLPGDLHEGSETASTLFYYYVHDSSGTLVPKISATPPNAAGYHPTQPTFRCIGAALNDGSSNLLHIDPVFGANGPYARQRYRYKHAAATKSPGLAATVWTEINLSDVVPAYARSVVIEVIARAGAANPFRLGYGPRSLVGTTEEGIAVLETGGGGSNMRSVLVTEIPLNPSLNPARIAWRIEPNLVNGASGLEQPSHHELRVLGW